MTKLAEQFFGLFAGLDRSHGWYVVEGQPNEKGKLEGRRATVALPPTVELWAKHLAGAAGLGIVPIRADNTCVWGCMDIDVYPLDLDKIEADCRRLKLPTVTGRTKSGGAHIYMFTKEPVSAELMRDKLSEWSIALGFAGCEIFPKQIRLASEKDYGSWLNMPYQNAADTTRYALGPKGKLSAAQFLALAAERALTEAEFEAFELDDDASDLFLDGPPCLQTLERRGFGDWQNDGMYNVCIYLRKRYGDEGWEKHADAYNVALMKPPLGHSDLTSMIKSGKKKKYSYACKKEPISKCCDRRTCLKREFGVGGLPNDPGVVMGDLVKLETKPPTWIWDVNGARMELTTMELMDQRRFQARAIEELSKWPQLVSAMRWQEIVREHLDKVECIQVPEDATREGQLWVRLQRFCTSRVVAKSLDEILLGKPYTDKELQRTYFCAADFLSYLTQHRVLGVTEHELYRWLRRRGVTHHESNIKKKFVNYWSVPAFQEQAEPFTVPRAPLEEFPENG